MILEGLEGNVGKLPDTLFAQVVEFDSVKQYHNSRFTSKLFMKALQQLATNAQEAAINKHLRN